MILASTLDPVAPTNGVALEILPPAPPLPVLASPPSPAVTRTSLPSALKPMTEPPAPPAAVLPAPVALPPAPAVASTVLPENGSGEAAQSDLFWLKKNRASEPPSAANPSLLD